MSTCKPCLEKVEAWQVLERARREPWSRHELSRGRDPKLARVRERLVDGQNQWLATLDYMASTGEPTASAIVLAVNTIAEAREALEEAADRLCFLIPIGDSRTAKVIDKARAVLARMGKGE